MQHYCEYRVTSDIDAWWEPSAIGEDRELVRGAPPTSPSYHFVRLWQGLPSQPYLGQQLASIRDDPSLDFV